MNNHIKIGAIESHKVDFWLQDADIGIGLNANDSYVETPIWFICDDTYEAKQGCTDSVIFIYKSLYYTEVSPSDSEILLIDELLREGQKVYCFGHEMFTSEAPYPVYRVRDGLLMQPEDSVSPAEPDDVDWSTLLTEDELMYEYIDEDGNWRENYNDE